MNESKKLQGKVVAYVDSIQLPTYIIKGENCNPVFRSQYGVAHIYPYTLQDDIASRPIDKTYRTLVVENLYLRVIVIPDLGGRVYSVYDKISQREVFYKNNIIKFSPLAIRGAFFSGGVEFSFPVAHAPTTADPVNWDMRQNKDGSASVSFGGIEHISRLRWMITLSLFPDRCALAQDVRLYNPYSLPGRYHYWTNASLDADDQTEFIYPLRRARSYEFAGTASWPFARLDLIQKDPGLPGMEGVPMWPASRMQEPVNFRWQKNMLAQVSIFGRDVAWDFFGAWQHSVNCGYAHFADHRDVSGMKLWSWGNAPVGVVNQSALTDDGSLYAETQCGAMETQLDFAFLPPDKVRAWREWWLPLRGMGGLSCASSEVSARLKLAEHKDTDQCDLTLGICPVRNLGNSHIQLAALDQIVFSEKSNLTPEQPRLVTFSVTAKDLGDKPLRLTIKDQLDKIVLDYTFERKASPVPPVIFEASAQPKSARDFYQLGLKHENFDNREQAMLAYSQAISASPEDGEAHLRLGLMLLRAADFTKASDHFRKTVSANILDGNYYLGIVALYENNLAEARNYWTAVPAEHPLYIATLLCRGSLAIREKDWSEAIECFEQAHRLDDQSITPLLLSAMASRQIGNTKVAHEKLLLVLGRDPLNHAALREMALLHPDTEYATKLARLLSDDHQYLLDLASYYFNVGLLEDALDVLVNLNQNWQYPLVAYLAAYLYHLLDRQESSDEWLSKATLAKPDYVFPSRLEEAVALRHAIQANPGDHKAKYYLGNLLVGRQRFEEGVQLWQQALAGIASFDVIYRNLGLMAWQQEKNYSKAIQLLEQALALNPNNQDLYLHLDDLYKIQRLPEKRSQLLQKINALPDVREDVHKRSILILVELGRTAEALQIMQTERFVPLEMDQSFHNLFVQALLQSAEDHIKAEQWEAAIDDCRKALEFPANLGVGQPTTLAQAQIYYQLGLAYEHLGYFSQAISAWQQAAREHHPHGSDQYPFVQMALDKLSRYSELGFE